MPRYTLSQVHKASERSRTSYARWVRQMTVLSMGSLTLLVSLQSEYAPPGSRFPWMLIVCWISLAASTASGAVIQWGEHETHLKMARKMRDQLAAPGPHRPIAVPPPLVSRIASSVLPLALASSMVFLCWFAVANISRDKPANEPKTAKTVHNTPA